MNCVDRDLDLLLLVHRECSPLKAVTTRLHLINCPRCQERFLNFQQATNVLVQGVRTTTPRISMAKGIRPVSFIQALPILALLGVIVTALALAIKPWIPQATLPASSRVSPNRPCAPALQSDHCQ